MRIELLKAHTHAGRSYPPGERLDLDEASANGLIDLEVAKAAAPESTQRPSRKGD